MWILSRSLDLAGTHGASEKPETMKLIPMKMAISKNISCICMILPNFFYFCHGVNGVLDIVYAELIFIFSYFECAADFFFVIAFFIGAIAVLKADEVLHA